MASIPTWLRVRARLVGGAGIVGLLAAPLIVAALVLLAGADPFAGSETGFAFGALWFGFGLLGWAGSVAVGDAVEAAQRRLDTGTRWTERSSRRAMARVGGFGAGLMVGTAAVGTLIGTL